MINRNEFLKLVGSFAGVALIPDFGFANASYQDSTFRLIDLHCHPGAFHRGRSAAVDQAFQKTLMDMNSANVQGAFVSIVTDSSLLQITDRGIVPKRKFNKGEAWNAYKFQRAGLEELITTSEAQIISSYDDFVTAEGNVSLFVACEGADFLEGSVDRLDEVYLDGVRSIQLVHYTPNDIGDLQTSDPLNQGLSAYGRQIVKRMNELGMVIDVAHASFKTVQGVAKTSSSPIILSHSILENGSDGPVSNRAISVEHAKVIAQTGGVIGVWPSGFSSDINDFADSTLKLIETVGLDHVGLGTDMDANYKPVIKSYLEVKHWTNALAEKGLTDEEIRKLVSGNAQRVLKQVLK